MANLMIFIIRLIDCTTLSLSSIRLSEAISIFQDLALSMIESTYGLGAFWAALKEK